jgi:hypothetical protein
MPKEDERVRKEKGPRTGIREGLSPKNHEPRMSHGVPTGRKKEIAAGLKDSRDSGS